MYISYYKSCYSESINIKDKNIHIISGMTSHQNVSDFYQELQSLAQKLFTQTNDEEIKDFYNYYIAEEESTAEVNINQMKVAIDDYIQNSPSDRLFSTVASLIQSLPAVKSDSYSCEGCGDCNFSHEVEIN